MILIDGPMPKRCAECPCFDDTMYGRCRVKDIWLGAEDGAWFSEQRPSWCPLKEIVQCKDCRCNQLCEITIDKPKDWFCVDGAKRE